MDFDESWPMPTERMEEVEVVCGRCNGSGKDPQIGSAGTNMMPVAAPCTTAYGGCGGSGRISAIAPKGSLTAARLRLADAAEAAMDADTVEAWQVFHEALAALRTARGA